MLLLVGPFFGGIPPILLSVDTFAIQKRRQHVVTACGHASNMSLHSSHQADKLLNGKLRCLTSFNLIITIQHTLTRWVWWDL